MRPAQKLLLPPFSRELVPFQGWVHIRVGNHGWRAVKFYRDPKRPDGKCDIVYPGDKPPRVYLWPVKGCAVMVWGYEHDLKACAELVLALIDAGAMRVVLVHEELPNRHVIYDTDKRPRAA